MLKKWLSFYCRNSCAYIYSLFLRFRGDTIQTCQEAAKGNLLLSVYSHNPSKKLFISVVKWFKKNGFRFIDTTELKSVLEGSIPIPKKAVFFSLDDAWKENYRSVIKYAQTNQIPITLFVPTEPVFNEDRYWWSYIELARKKGIIYETVQEVKSLSDSCRRNLLEKSKRLLSIKQEAMTAAQIKHLKGKNFTIGSHTVSHPILTQCEDSVSRFEIIHSKNELEAYIRKPVTCFSYPNGSYGEREIEYLKTAGYEMAFTTEPEYIKIDKLPDRYQIPRFDILEHVSFSENICRMTGVWFIRKQKK